MADDKKDEVVVDDDDNDEKEDVDEEDEEKAIGEEIEGEEAGRYEQDLAQLPATPPEFWYGHYEKTHQDIQDILAKNKLLLEIEPNRWLKDHYPTELEADDVAFIESLLICDKRHRVIGKFQLDVKIAPLLSYFEVFSKAKFRCIQKKPYVKNNFFLHGQVDMKYRTISENRKECDKGEGIKQKNKLSLKYDEDGYKINCVRTEKQGAIKKIFSDEINYTLQEMNKVLTETSFIILLRYLARTQVEGVYKFFLLFIDGTKCETKLRIYKTRLVKYHQNVIEVKDFYKAVICPNGKLQFSQITMTKAGQIIFQSWSDSNLKLILPEKMVLYLNEKPVKDLNNLIPLRYRFWERPELCSYYTDQYYKNIEDYKSYLYQNPEFSNILKFFLKEVLLKKPHRVIQFASGYFAELL